jgi:hypothetical protein
MENSIKTEIWRALTYGIDHNSDPATSAHESDFDLWLRYNSSSLGPLTREQIVFAQQSGFGAAMISEARPFGVTSKGYICVLQDGMEGHVIAVLCEGRVPFLPRSAGEGKYQILGEAYVQGLMKGEALLLGDLLETRLVWVLIGSM